MTRGRRFVLMAVVALGVGAGLLFMFGPQPEPPVATAPAPRVLPIVAPVARQPVPEEPAPPMPGREQVADAVGGFAIQCEVGSQLDGVQLRGGLAPHVRDGWFSTVVMAHAGSLPIAEPGESPTFLVRWKDGGPRCTVEWVDHAELQIEVVDTAGRPRAAPVTACGHRGESGTDGLISLTVPVLAEGCSLSSVSSQDPTFRGSIHIPPLTAGEVREVQLLVKHQGADWRPSPDSLKSADEQVRALETLRERTGADAAVDGALETARQRAELQRATQKQRLLLDEVEVVTARFREGDPDALDELGVLGEDLLENALHRQTLLDGEKDRSEAEAE